MRKQHTKAQRLRLIRLVAEEGRTVREAARQLSVRPSTAYYWIRRATAERPAEELAMRSEPPAAAVPSSVPTFARLVRFEEAAAAAILELRIADATIIVRPDFDAALLRAVVAALTEPSS